jgi:ABC-2 type transport system ATP-binding protein
MAVTEQATTPAAVKDTNAPLVKVENLVRRFGDFAAVNDISFEVNHKEIFGLLGPNGAGKSTTIKMICTLLTPSAGQITVAGYNTIAKPDEVRSSIGIVFQDNSLDSGLTGQENLEFHCMMYHIPRAQRTDRIKNVLNMMGLTDFKDKLIKTYSGGMRRRLEIARGLLHEPRLLILDEPTVGLDPQTRHYIWEYVRDLRAQHDTAIFMTTHYMDEAEYCDRIAIMDQGKIIALDTPDGLRRVIGTDQIDLVIRDAAAATAIIQETFNLAVIPQDEPGHLSVSVPDADHFVPRLIAALTPSEQNVGVESLQVRRASLEDVFIKMTGHTIREEEGGKDERRLTVRRMGRM